MHGRDYQFTVTLEARNEFYNLFYYYCIDRKWQTMTRSVSRDSLNSQSSFMSSLWITSCPNAHVAYAVLEKVII